MVQTNIMCRDSSWYIPCDQAENSVLAATRQAPSESCYSGSAACKPSAKAGLQSSRWNLEYGSCRAAQHSAVLLPHPVRLAAIPFVAGSAACRL